MAYALVPEGYTLKKVNKEQKEALSEFTQAQTLRRLAAAPNSGVIVVTAVGVGLYLLSKQFYIPNFRLTDILLNLIPGVSVGELSPEQSATIQRLFKEGAGPDASAIMQLAFPTPEQREAGKETADTGWKKTLADFLKE